MGPTSGRSFVDFYCPVASGYRDGSGVLPYDKAASRAQTAKFKPPKNISSDTDRTLFISHLSEQIQDEDINKAFSHYGDVQEVRIVRDIVTGASRGYGFVVLSSRLEVNAAWRDMAKLCIGGVDVVVEREFGRSMKNWVPRRYGGGLGGKKESGQLRFGGRARPFVSVPTFAYKKSSEDNHRTHEERKRKLNDSDYQSDKYAKHSDCRRHRDDHSDRNMDKERRPRNDASRNAEPSVHSERRIPSRRSCDKEERYRGDRERRHDSHRRQEDDVRDRSGGDRHGERESRRCSANEEYHHERDSVRRKHKEKSSGSDRRRHKEKKRHKDRR